MKKKIRIFILLSLIGLSSALLNAQTTITLQPDESNSKDVSIWNIMPDQVNGNCPDFIATAWTYGGSLSIMRGLIDFDLSSIPSNSTITNATLSLYHYNSTANTGHSTSSGSNACYLKRITSAWNESTVTWNNQPSTTTQNQVIIPQSTDNSQDYPNINVTNLIQDIYNNPTTSYGMMMMLQDENYYRSLLFASSINADPLKRPKLTVTYIANVPVNDSCVTVTPDEAWKDAIIWNVTPGQNAPLSPDFIATAWTYGGSLSILRSLLKFNIPVPSNAIITSATLSLYHYNSTANIGHSTTSGSNSSALMKVTSAWDENTVTWNNQPGTTTQNQVILPASTNDSQDYPNIDITNIVVDFHNNPATNYGLMFKLLDENYYRSLLFGSKNCTDIAKLPKIIICYHIPNGVTENILHDISLRVYPNPSKDNLVLDLQNSSGFQNTMVSIYDIQGQLLLQQQLIQQKTELNISNFAQGVYIVKVNNNSYSTVTKFMKE